jgi:hypothetical protein
MGALKSLFGKKPGAAKPGASDAPPARPSQSRGLGEYTKYFNTEPNTSIGTVRIGGRTTTQDKVPGLNI